MIELYTGFVGSGKSYHALSRGCQIADAPKGKRWVVANFPISPKKKLFARIPYFKRYVKNPYNQPRWIYKNNEELTVDFLIQTSIEKGWKGKESSALLIFDEAGIPFNSRDWNAKPKERLRWIEFLSQSRKFGYDVVFIAQDQRMIDRQIRSLCEYEVKHKKLNNYGYFKLFPTTVFAAVSFWNGIKESSGKVSLTFYSKSTAERYDTMKLFGYEEEEEESGEGGTAEAEGSLPGSPPPKSRKGIGGLISAIFN